MNTIAISEGNHTKYRKKHNFQKVHQNDEVRIVPILDTYTKRFARAGLLAVLEITKP